jgi:hypothetical protein
MPTLLDLYLENMITMTSLILPDPPFEKPDRRQAGEKGRIFTGGGEIE